MTKCKCALYKVNKIKKKPKNMPPFADVMLLKTIIF